MASIDPGRRLPQEREEQWPTQFETLGLQSVYSAAVSPR